MATKIEGLPIQKEWTVVNVREGTQEPGEHGGTLKKFYVDFEGAPDVYWRRKMPATVEVGKSYYGTISEGKHGPVFKKESPGQGGGGGGTRSGGAGAGRSGAREWKPESQYDPEKVARMGRAHAQGMAIEVCKAMGIFESKSAEQIDASIKKWTDYFEADVNRAGEAAKARASSATGQTAQGAGSAGRTAASRGAQVAASEESGPAPAQASEGEDPQWIEKVCEDAGLNSYSAGRLGLFIQKLSPADQRRAVGGLSNFDSQGEVLAELKSGYEQHEGEPLPEGAPEDDIPF